MKHHFLFGAGASAFSGRCEPTNPPTGDKLFAALEGSLRCVKEIPNDIRALFAPEFEVGMDALWRTRPELMQSFLQDMAKYFLQFVPTPSNHYIELIRLLGSKKVVVNLATLNYDLLIERSIETLGMKYHHPLGPPVPNAIPVLKLHGSCNIVPDLGVGSISGILINLGPPPGPGITVTGIGGDMAKSLPVNEMYDFLHPEQTLVPCVAMYHKTKSIRDCPSAINRIQSTWRESLKTTERLFVIGTRFVQHDTHIWESIAAFPGELCWVSPEASEAEEWAKGHGLKFMHYAKTFEEFIPRYKRDF